MHFSMPLPRRSRHPLLRAISLLLGVAVVSVLMVCGLVVAGVLLVGGLVVMALRSWTRARASVMPRRAPRADVIEGEFVVLHPGQPAIR